MSDDDDHGSQDSLQLQVILLIGERGSSCIRRSSNASEIFLRKMGPRTMCLFSAASPSRKQQHTAQTGPY